MARRLPAVAAPVLCGAAAAFAVAGTPVTSMAATQAHTGHATPARLVSATGPAAKQTAAKPAAPVTYTVKSGDTLSTIAQRYYKDPNYWPAIYWANHKQVRYANVIDVGQVLAVPAKPAHAPAAPSAVSPAPAPGTTSSSTSSHTPSYTPSAPVHHYSAPAERNSSATSTSASTSASTSVPASGDSGFQSCVISRESGGSSQVMSSNGHYGLYQFSSSTWAAYGGSSADFGHASVSEQNRVFNNALAAGGRSNWSAYDGC